MQTAGKQAERYGVDTVGNRIVSNGMGYMHNNPLRQRESDQVLNCCGWAGRATRLIPAGTNRSFARLRFHEVRVRPRRGKLRCRLSSGRQHAMKIQRANFFFLLLRNAAYPECAAPRSLIRQFDGATRQ